MGFTLLSIQPPPDTVHTWWFLTVALTFPALSYPLNPAAAWHGSHLMVLDKLGRFGRFRLAGGLSFPLHTVAVWHGSHCVDLDGLGRLGRLRLAGWLYFSSPRSRRLTQFPLRRSWWSRWPSFTILEEKWSRWPPKKNFPAYLRRLRELERQSPNLDTLPPRPLTEVSQEQHLLCMARQNTFGVSVVTWVWERKSEKAAMTFKPFNMCKLSCTTVNWGYFLYANKCHILLMCDKKSLKWKRIYYTGCSISPWTVLRAISQKPLKPRTL
jgi:hypothetical protein